MADFGVGIIGCGHVAEQYIRAFQAEGRCQVRALVNRSLDRPEAYRERFQLACDVDTHCAGMLRRNDIHLVVVATPHDMHTPYVIEAAEAGKHILVEKPLALSSGEVRRQTAAVAQAEVKSMASFVHRWSPLLQTVNRLIDQGVFGQVLSLDVDYFYRLQHDVAGWYGTRKQGGSAFVAAGCHAVDAVRWLARSEVRAVSAFSTRIKGGFEYPGTANALLQFEDGKSARCTTCFDSASPSRMQVAVHGTEGTLRDGKLFAPRLFPGQHEFLSLPCAAPILGDLKDYHYEDMVAHFLDCLEADEWPQPDLDDGAATMRACFAIDQSIAEGRTVTTHEV